MNPVLVIDHKLASELNIQNALALMPSIGQPLSCRIKSSQYSDTTKAIVRTNERIAKLFAERVYSKFLPYDPTHLEVVYYGFGTGISFLICDRLLRLNRMIGESAAGAISVLAPDYTFHLRSALDDEDFYAGTIEDDALFNQWILSRLTPTFPKHVLAKEEKITSKELVHYQPKASFLVRLRERFSKGALTFHKVLSTLCILTGELALKSGLFKPKCLATGAIGTLRESFMMSGGFFWPLGPLCYVPTKGFEFDGMQKPSIPRDEFANLGSEIGLIFKEYLQSLGDKIHLPEESFLAIAKIISDLLPELAVEKVGPACELAVSNLKRTRSDSYFTYAPIGGPIGVLYNLAARHLGKKIIGTQHSAWGGYLAGGALITELLIRGTDDYITFGWTNKEPGMASWRKQAIPMPSPLLSTMAQSASQDKFVCTSKVQRKILFCAGFLYRFPMIYNSGLKIDLVDRWVQGIESLLRALAAQNIQVSIKMYNRSIAKLYDSILQRWVKAGANLVEEFHDHDIRVRAVLNSGTFYEQFDAVVWDIPTGGFTEALACGVRTFAFLDEGGIVTTLPESKATLEELFQSGILFSSAEKLCSALEAMYSDPSWYKDQLPSILHFQEKYFRISKSWRASWLDLLSSEQGCLSALAEGVADSDGASRGITRAP